MGNSRLISKEERSKVESISLTESFEEACPIYMSYGMSYNDFWYGPAFMAKFYRDAYNIKIKQQDENNWMAGMYVYEAILDCSPILRPFSKKGTKPLPYSEHPYTYDAPEYKTEEEKQKEIENQRLLARLHFETWARETKKRFEKKQGGD